MPKYMVKSILILALFVSNKVTGAENAFFENLQSLCGQSFSGEMTFPVDDEHSFAGKRLLAHNISCSKNEVSMSFQVGEDTSRTWFFSKIEDGIVFKHEHRHIDGSLDKVSNYGGSSTSTGTALQQTFPADEFTQSLIPEAATNVWSITLDEEKQSMTYHLERHQKPRFTTILNLLEK